MKFSEKQLPEWINLAIERNLLSRTEVLQWLLEEDAETREMEDLLLQSVSEHPAARKILDLRDRQPISDACSAGTRPTPTVSTQHSRPVLSARSSANDVHETMVGGRSRASGTGDSRPSESDPSASRQVRSPSSTSDWRARTRSLPVGFERYQIRQEIGRGGCGVVSLAFDHQLQRLVVIKQVLSESSSNEAATRFLNEAQITGQLAHPGIVPVYEMGQDRSGMPFYVMKHLDGKTLTQLMEELRETDSAKTSGPAGSHQLLQRFLDVCQTLAYAHQFGVIHRDLKPSNIMVGAFGETVVLDWGLARRVGDSRADSNQDQTLNAAPTARQPAIDPAESVHDRRHQPASAQSAPALTQLGAVLGTAAYMSPEQARGANTSLDQRSDVFSLGVILYEILSGISPFRSETLDNTIENVVRCHYRPLEQVRRGVAKPLAAICAKAMSAEPEDRYQDARQLAMDVERHLAGLPVTARQESWLEKWDRLANRHRTIVRTGFAASIVIALVAGIATVIVSSAHHAEKQARVQAVQAQQDTLVALQQKSAEATFANRQLQESRQAADTWLLQLSGDLQFYPGLQPLRLDLIQQAVEHYEQLVDEAEKHQTSDEPLTDWVVERKIETARNLIRLGDLHQLSGATQSAHTSFQSARERLVQLLPQSRLAKDPLDANRVHDVELEICNSDLGRAFSSDDPQLARTIVESAEQNLNRLLHDQPNDRETRHALARCKLIFARMIDSSQPELAELKRRQGLAEADLLVQGSTDRKYVILRENLLRDAAQAHTRRCDWQAAESSFRQLLRHLEQADAATADRPDHQESLSWAKSYLATCLEQMGRSREALSLWNQAESDLGDAWSQLYAVSYYRENQAVLDFNQARLLAQSGNQNQAIERARLAIDRLRQVIQDQQPTSDRIQQMTRFYLLLSRLLADRQPEQAQQWNQQATVLIDHLAQQPGWKETAEALRWESECQQLEQQLILAPTEFQIPDSHAFEQGRGFDSEQARSARALRLQCWNDRNRAESDSDSRIMRWVNLIPTDVADRSLDEGLQIARLLLELPQDPLQITPMVEHTTRQLVERFPESQQAWEARFLAAARSGDVASATSAWERVKWCRIDVMPEHTWFEEWLRLKSGSQSGAPQSVAQLQQEHGGCPGFWGLAIEATLNADATASE